jgi:hypothetical protein
MHVPSCPHPPIHPQVAEVEVLKTLTQAELAAFAQEVLGSASPARRKVAVLIRGSREFAAGTNQQQQQQQEGEEGTCPADGNSSSGDAAGEAGSCSAGETVAAATAGVCSSSSSSGSEDVAYAATAVPVGERFLLVRDVAAFKRGCEVWPAAGQQHSRQLLHKKQAVLSGQGTAAAGVGDGGVGEAAAAAQSEEAVPGAAKL